MSTEFKREDRYIVFKLSDLGNSLKGDEIRRLAREYAEQRSLKGKPPLECVVVESDWPEYEPTWKAIEARVTGTQSVPEESAIQTAARIMNLELIRERDALRAKIERMEQQEPVDWQSRSRPTWNDGTWGQWSKCSEEYAQDIKKTPLLHDWLYEARALYTLPGAKGQPTPTQEDESVRKSWARFSNELHRSPDAPYPGMSEAFEQHFSQSFTDREWRAEAATWAAAWKAAKRHFAQPAPSVPEVTIEMEHAFYEKVTVTRVGSIVGLAEGIKAAMLAAAPEAKP